MGNDFSSSLCNQSNRCWQCEKTPWTTAHLADRVVRIYGFFFRMYLTPGDGPTSLLVVSKIQNPKYPGKLTLLKENTGSLTLVRTATDPTTEKVLGFGLAGGSRPDSESSSISGPSGAAEAAAFWVAGCDSPEISVLGCLTPDLAMAVGVGSFSIGVGITRKIQIK